MAIGGSAGYLTINPTEDYMGQAAQRASDSFERIRAEKYQKERDKMADDQKLREQRRRDFKDAEEFSAKYPFVAMGNKSIDSKKRQDLETGKKRYNDALDRYEATGDKKELAMANSILETIKEIPEMGKSLSLTAEGWLKNEADLNPSSLAKAKKILEVIQTDMTLDYDENGRSVYSIPKRDDAGNITGYLHKNISGEQLKELLAVEPKFDVTGEKGMYAQFRKVLDKPNVVIEPKGNYKVTTTSYPEAESTAETMANEAVNNHSAMYWAMEQIKEDEKGNPIQLDPEDKSNYSNPKVKEIVYDFVKKDLMKKAQTTVSKERDFGEANHNLALQKEANDQKQRKLDNAFKEKEFNQKQIEDGYVTVGQTKYIFTPEGKAAQKKFYSNPDNKGKAMTAADYPADQINYYVERTSKKVNPNVKKAAAKPAAKAAPKKEDLRSKYKY